MKKLLPTLCLSVSMLAGAFSQGDTTYLSAELKNAASGTFSFQLMNYEPSQLTTPQALWVYGDGNFEIKYVDALAATHQFRIAPVEDVSLYSFAYFERNNTGKRKGGPIKTGNTNLAFTPTGGATTASGWVPNGHYAAIKVFPEEISYQSTPVTIMALLNHQSSPVSGTAYLYYKTNLKRNGVDDIPVSFSVFKEHYNYGGVTAQNTLNAPVKPGYQILRAWNFTDLQPNEERHLFVSLDTTPSWKNIPDLATATYETEFLLFVRGNGAFAFEKEAFISARTGTPHDPAFLDVSFDSREETTFDLLFYNEGTMPVGDIQVVFEFPAGMKPGDFQILEKAIGPVDFLAEPHSTEGVTTLKFEAKNVGLGKYDANNPNTYGKIKIKAKMAPENWQGVKASVKFDDLPAEAALWRNVPNSQN